MSRNLNNTEVVFMYKDEQECCNLSISDWLGMINNDVSNRNNYSGLALIISNLSLTVIILFGLFSNIIPICPSGVNLSVPLSMITGSLFAYVLYKIVSMKKEEENLTKLRMEITHHNLRNLKTIQNQYDKCFKKNT